MSSRERLSIPELTDRERWVLEEVQRVFEYPHAGAPDGYIRAYHVRYFRSRPEDEIHPDATLPQIDRALRSLTRKGYLEKRPKRAEYRLVQP
jgi:hypothetical protein